MAFIIVFSVICVVYYFNCCRGYNLEYRHVDIITDPANDSYFGYALALTIQSTEGTDTPWLLVGAPQGGVPMGEGRKRKTGQVYKCPQLPLNGSLPTFRNCTPLYLADEGFKYNEVNEILDGSWLGSTIAVENKTNGAVAICATRMKAICTSDSWVIPGKCFGWEHFNATANEKPNYTKVWSLDNVKCGLKTKGDAPYLSGLAQIGMSAHFVNETNSAQLLLGAPGIILSTGVLVVSEKMKLQELKLYKPAGEENYKTKIVGYSVTSARFHKDRRISYITGAPRDIDVKKDYYTGRVYVGTINKKWKEIAILSGNQLGEYFGACLAAIDLNQDGVDDFLLVGAPHYSKRNAGKGLGRDEGRVQIFSFNEKADSFKEEQELMSDVIGGHFGSSLANVGDLDRDGFNDLAVGAPNEDYGKGAVYIYRWNGQRLSESQKLSANKINPGLRGFGISISSGVDLDDNSFNDLAIGSFLSAQTVIVKSYPVIDIEPSLEPNPSKLDFMDRSFTINACLNYTNRGKQDTPSNILAEMVIIVDSINDRTVFSAPNNGSQSNVTVIIKLHNNRKDCSKINVTIKKDHDTKKNEVVQPIKVEMKYKVIDEPSINREKIFCKLCPMTNPYLNPTLNPIFKDVPITKNCKNVTCKEKLELQVESSYNQTYPLILGKHNNISLAVSISNVGDPAYGVMLGLIGPKWIKVIQISRNLNFFKKKVDITNEDTIAFPYKLVNPILNETSENIIMLDVSLMPLDTLSIKIKLKTWVGEEETNETSISIQVPVKLLSQLHISGFSSQEKVSVVKSPGNESNSIIISHIYQVVNRGPSPVSAIDVQFKVPFAIKKTPLLYFIKLPCPMVTVGSDKSECDVDYKGTNSTATPVTNSADYTKMRRLSPMIPDIIYAEINCTASFFKSLTIEQRVRFEIQLLVDTNAIDPLWLSDVSLVTLGTLASVGSENNKILSNSTQVVTMFLGKATREVASWIIVISIILSLILMAILILVLKNLGFFKRNDREKLKMEKNNALEEEKKTEDVECSEASTTV